MIAPLGGRLTECTVHGEEALALSQRAAGLPVVRLDAFQRSDLELLANGAYSPLTGFMSEEDYHGVLDHMHLANGLPFPLPVTLGVTECVAGRLEEGMEVGRASCRERV